MTSLDHTLTDADTSKTFISHQEMRAHLAAGRAVPLSCDITDHAKFNDAWWLADRSGWHLIVDEILTIKLNRLSTWMDGNLYLGESAS